MTKAKAASALHETLFVLSVCGVTILNIFVNGALIVALPTLGRALDFSESELQWPLNVYALSYGSLLLLCGRVADIVGSKRMFLFGTGFFAIWSIATGVAPTKVSLIVFVALTGVGAAANTPTGVGIFANHFEPGPRRNRAIAALGAGQAIGYVVGLIGAGFVCQKPALWRVIFYIQGGLAAIFFVLGVLTIPPDGAHTRYTMGVDWVGAVLSVCGVGLLTFVLSESTSVPDGWRTPWVPALLVVSLLVLAAFIAWEAYRERRGRSVIMPIALWTKPGTKMAPIVAVVFLAWASYNSLSYFVVLFFQQIRGDDPLHTSLETMPFAFMAFAANVIAGWLLGVVRGDVLIGVGLLGSMTAPLLFALIDVHASYWRMAFPLMLTIAWTDVAYTVGNLQLSVAFDASSQALAGGIFNVATRLGTSLALALASAVADAVSGSYARGHPGLADESGGGDGVNGVSEGEAEVLMVGFRAAGWVSFALAAAAFAVCVFGVRGVGVIGKKVNPADVDAGASANTTVDSGEADADAEKADVGVESGRGAEKRASAQVVVLPPLRISTDARGECASVLVQGVRRHSLQVPSVPSSPTRVAPARSPSV